MPLSTAVIAFESEEAAKRRLEGFGYAPDVAAEIAVYLAQSTDLPGFVREIGEAPGALPLPASTFRRRCSWRASARSLHWAGGRALQDSCSSSLIRWAPRLG